MLGLLCSVMKAALLPGAKVEVVGLQTRTELNKHKGILGAFDRQAERWQVDVRGIGFLKIKKKTGGQCLLQCLLADFAVLVKLAGFPAAILCTTTSMLEPSPLPTSGWLCLMQMIAASS